MKFFSVQSDFEDSTDLDFCTSRNIYMRRSEQKKIHNYEKHSIAADESLLKPILSTESLLSMPLILFVSFMIGIISMILKFYPTFQYYSIYLSSIIQKRSTLFQIEHNYYKLRKTPFSSPDCIYGISVLSHFDQENQFIFDENLYYSSMIKCAEIRRTKSLYTIHWLEDQPFLLKSSTETHGTYFTTMHLFDGYLLLVNKIDGIVYRMNENKQISSYIHVFRGNGSTSLPKLIDWSATQYTKLYIGSSSIYYKPETNEFLYSDPYVYIYDRKTKEVKYQNWESVYNHINNHPSFSRLFFVHNTIFWSYTQKQWYLFPKAYKKEDYIRALNIHTLNSIPINFFLTITEDMQHISIHPFIYNTLSMPKIEIEDAKFLNYEEKVIIGTYSIQFQKNSTAFFYRSAVLLMDIQGHVYSWENQIPGKYHYKGIGLNFGY
ncbi:hypothetical protein WA158_002506 [Blastocystis sp. Blastoise]